MKKYGLFIKIIELVLIIISVAILVWGFVKGFPATVADDNGTVDPLLYWAYIMIGLALFAILIIGLGIAIKNNPKVLLRYGLILVGAAALCLVCYLLAKGEMAHGLSPTAPIPSAAELKFTDTILNLTQQRILGLTNTLQGTSINTLRHMVATGLGISLLPASALNEHEHLPYSIIPFKAPAPSRCIILAYRKTTFANKH